MKHILIEELHITFSVPRELPDKGCRRTRRTLQSVRFRRALDRAIRQLLRRYPSLRQARMAITQ